MRLFVSIEFDEKTKDNLMGVMENLKKCSRKGMFYERDDLRLNFLMINNISDIKPFQKFIDDLKRNSFSVKFTRIDRSRREGGDIYWTVAEKNPFLDDIYSRIKCMVDENGFEYDEKAFKPRVQLGKNIIARPNFKFEEFEGIVKKISIVKYVQAMGRDIYKELYVRKCKNDLK